MLTKILLIILLIVYTIYNLLVAKFYDAKEMKENFIDDQCAVGLVCANIFYAPAWLLKLMRASVVMAIK